MARTWVLIAATLLLAAGAPATAAERPAGSRAAATTSAAETAAKKKVPARCRRLKGTKRSRCVAKAKRCRKGFVKRYNRRRTRARCVRRLGRPVAPKPPPALTPSVAPIDYTKIKGLSRPVFTPEEIERTPVEVPAHDGVNLYVEVIRPKAPGRYPVILEASGYHGTLYARDGTRILPEPKDDNGRPLGLTGYFAPRGYAIVMLDIRGTGRSGGCLDHLGQNDLKDIRTTIEWAASQPWSNGRVGMTGHSYVGGTTNLGGASGARGLATIVPSASLASIYDHQFQNGVPFWLQWAGPIEAYEQLALQADLPPQLSPLTQATGNGPTGDNFGNDPQYTGCGMTNSAAVAGDGQLTGQYKDFHAQRDHIEAVRKADIPIFLQHGTIDQAARIGGAQWMFERGLRPGDKLWVGQWDHGVGSAPTRRGLQWTYALHAWFDRHLMGLDVDTGPPLEVFVNDEISDAKGMTGQGLILAGTTLPTTRPYTLFAREDEGLAEAPGQPGTVSFVGDARGFDGNERTEGATFETVPLTADKLFFGLPQITLAASVTNPQVHLIATLFAVDDSGLRRRLTQCAMNPILREGNDQPAPVTPSQVYELRPSCFAVAYQARKGQRLRMRVTTSDPDKVPMHSQDPRITVAFGGPQGTQIALPEVVGQATFADTIDLGDLIGDPSSGG